MAGNLDYDGKIYLSKNGKHYVIDLKHTVFRYRFGRQAMRDLDKGLKKTVAVWHPKPREAWPAAAKDPDL